ncbi:voltage-gated hydrogen channel 1-like [Tropilaelaps mercedesae]|uniref:Voltage-gated hydrogen channel 1-like n=1 Tax=Tropilaelaps mercedesae TaxID=418985 RepID=A0A1V9XML3_9ACAR|nr:voltage-gated hydrogen channel 1-like [Tropilaelaps mercedesae]
MNAVMEVSSVRVVADCERPHAFSLTDAAEAASSQASAGQDLRVHETFRVKLHRFLHSHRFHVAVVILIIVDCLLVVVELLAEMRVLELNGSYPLNQRLHSPLADILHNLSIAILSVFVIEIIGKMYAFGLLGFLRHKLEVILQLLL